MRQSQDLFLGLYVGFVWNLGVASLVNNPIEPSSKAWFTVMGAANELLGVLMIASPELLPRLQRLFRYLLDRMANTMNRLGAVARRILRLRHHVYASLTAAIEGSGSLHASVIRGGPPPNATAEELVQWLLERVVTLRTEVDDLRERVDQMPSEWRNEVEAARRDARGYAETLVQGLSHQYIALRLLGLSFVVLGIFLGAASNVIS